MSRPLEGVRVLDLTNMISGPHCCYHLALMGAAVTKVEQPVRGDLGRKVGAGTEFRARNMGSLYLGQNAGKRSITLNLKHEAARAVLFRLLETADVLVENFRPGVMQRLGLDYETLRAKHPGLVYCAISGFGQDSPFRDNPAYDQIVQGMSGAMSTTGTPESGPLRAGYPVCDTVGGMNAAYAIACALFGRQQGGEGCFIDVSLLDSMLSAMGWATSNALVAHQPPVLVGNDNFSVSPSGAFRCADAPINIAANSQQQYESLCRGLGRAELIDDPRFADEEGRMRHRDALKAEIERTLTQRPVAEWVAVLNAAGVPAGPVVPLTEALAHPHVRERGRVQRLEGVSGLEGPVEVFTAGYALDGKAPQAGGPPPALGEHTDQVLTELGYTAGEIAGLREQGAL